VERLNLISCTGYKSANLIATKSEDGAERCLYLAVLRI
jgi:hypothetical protein